MEPDWQGQQKQDQEAQFMSTLAALQKVYRAGLTDEAYLLAFQCGLFTDFNKELANDRHR